MRIILESDLFVITEILKTTGAKMFKDCEVGDELIFSTYIRDPGHGRGLYATYILVRNVTKDIKESFSFSQLSKRLKNFEFANVDFGRQ